MDARKRNWITWAFVALTVLVVAMMLGSTLHRTTYIHLPAPGSDSEESQGDLSGGALSLVTVTPETAGTVVATLSRPTEYRRTVTIEQIWSGGSTTTETEVVVLNGWTRTDRDLPGGQVRHAVTDGETTYIWYDNQSTVYEAAAGDITADNEQAILTYEDILELSEEQIAAADYRAISGVNCVYVETEADSMGYVLRYWVSVDTGLLTAAEKLLDGEPVYRMAALELSQTPPSAADFTLPDGRVLTAST